MPRAWMMGVTPAEGGRDSEGRSLAMGSAQAITGGGEGAMTTAGAGASGPRGSAPRGLLGGAPARAVPSLIYGTYPGSYTVLRR